MKKFLSVICALILSLALIVPVTAAVEITDVFGNDYVHFDFNMDSKLDILDLIRAKKYMGGIPVTVNMKFVQKDLSDAEILVSLKQELLKDGDMR